MISSGLTSTPKHQERTCCGVIEEAANKAHEKRANRTKPQPWIVRKLMVALTLGIMIYTTYVYIGRLCVPMIRRKSDAGAGRSTGVALLVVFTVLLLWMLWAYEKIVLTAPGFARAYVAKTPQPLIPLPQRGISWTSTAQTHPDTSITHPDARSHRTQPSQVSHDPLALVRTDSIGGPSYEDMPMSPPVPGKDYRFERGEMRSAPDVHMTLKNSERKGGEGEGKDMKAGVLDALPKPTLAPSKVDASPAIGSGLAPRQGKDKARAPVFRRPPTAPVLIPAHLYCSRDGIVKPYRAHHCRICGTCVLKYDHHCPWIGQCVGARNQKFFLNFCQAAAIFTLYTFSTLVAYTVRANNTFEGNIDPQKVVIIALSAVFGLFTTTLTVSHVRQIWLNQSTVESMQVRGMKDREADALRKVYRWWEFGAKQQVRQEWDAEWGALNTEGNIWWLGSGSKCWVDVMGTNKWGWFLPIGRSMSDGLTYPINPRFDEQGRWRRRADWPAELR